MAGELRGTPGGILLTATKMGVAGQPCPAASHPKAQEPSYPGRGLHPALDQVLDQWRALLVRIDAEGAAMRARLTPRDVRQLHRARALFHLCSVLPCALYYLGTSERPTKFPATISFTIRKGPPRWAHHAVWCAGWALMGDVIRRAGSGWVQRFSASMFATGVWTVVVFRLGHGRASDVAHFLGAASYMIDHEVLSRLLGVWRAYHLGFRVAFAVLIGALARGHALERRAGVGSESRVSPTARARQTAAAPPHLRRSLWRADMVIMIAENLLFSSFVHGLTSGVPPNGGADATSAAGCRAAAADEREARLPPPQPLVLETGDCVSCGRHSALSSWHDPE